MKRCTGLWTALITPFLDDGSLDKEGLKTLLHLQRDAKVDGIVLCASTGEGATLTLKEKESILQIARSELKEMPLMAATGTNSTQSTIEQTCMAKNLGADFAIIISPYYNKPTQEGLFRHFEAIANQTELPIVVYNNAARTAVNIETKTMKRIAELPNVVGIKEASGNINQIGDVICENPHLNILSGDDVLTYCVMALGGVGVISTISNLFPKEMKALVDACRKGEFLHARKLHFLLLPFFKAAFLESNPIPIKEAMRLVNLPAGPCRLPLSELSDSNKKILRALLCEKSLLAF